MPSWLGRLGTINWILAAILALGLGLRLWGIGYGLPYTYAADEPTYLTIALKILRTGDLNPHWWYYPSLMFYINAVLFAAYFLAGRLMGAFVTPADIPLPDIITMGVGRLAMPSEFLLARGLNVLFCTGGILLVFWTGRRLFSNKWTAAVAAFFFAISPTAIDASQRIGPDLFAMFFALVAFYFAVRIVDQPTLGNYIGAGIGAGLAIASKYNAGMILVPLVVAHVLRYGIAGWRRKELYIGLGVAAAAFLIGTPFALLDFRGFWDGVRFQAFSYSAEGHAGQEGDALRWYVMYLWQSEGWILVAAVAGVAGTVLLRSKKQLLVISYPLFYFVLVSLMFVRNARTILQIVPWLDLLAAGAIVTAAEWLIQGRRARPVVVAAACALLVVLMSVLPVQSVIASNAQAGNLGDRETARQWIDQNLKPGSRIALEAYSPYVDPRRYVVQGDYALIDHTPDWYVQNGFEYLVFSYGAYGRYFEDANRYSEYAAQYDRLWESFFEVASFDKGFPVRIFKTNTNMVPSQRVAAEWGMYAPWFELAGYDWKEPNLTLYWRMLQTRRENFQLTARLLDKDDGEVARFTSELFGGAKNPDPEAQGIVRVPLSLNVPSRARPGVYHLELAVDGNGVGRVPVLGVDHQPVSDKSFVGQFKFAPDQPSAAELEAAQTVDAGLGDAIRLDKYRPVQTPVHPGEKMVLRLYWQCRASVAKDYTTFIHLLDGQGQVRAQVDASPRGGTYPTSTWDPGEIVTDDYTIAVPSDVEPGEYKIEVGMYEYPSLARLAVMDLKGQAAGDSIIIGTVRVAK